MSVADEQVVDVSAIGEALVDGQLVGTDEDMSDVAPVYVDLMCRDDHGGCLEQGVSEEGARSADFLCAQFRGIELRESELLECEGVKAEVDDHFDGVAVLAPCVRD